MSPRSPKFWKKTLSALLLAGASTLSAAADWPEKAITLVAPFTPGGTTDIVARMIAAQLQTELGQPVVVENKPGAGGTLGATFVARSRPDGYTLLLSNVGHTAANALYKGLPYRFDSDMTHITTVTSVSNVLIVNKSLPVNNVKELLAYLTTQSANASYGSAGVGTTQHLSAELLKKQTGIDVLHVPYKGAAPMMADIIGGRVTFALDSAASASTQLKGGNVKALAVTSATRSRFLPDVPTLAEAGVPGYEMTTWYGLAGPKGLSKAVRDRIHQAVVVSMKAPAVQTALQNMAADVGGMPPEQFEDFVRAETKRWTAIASAFPISE